MKNNDLGTTCVKYSGGNNTIIQRYFVNCGSVDSKSLNQKNN